MILACQVPFQPRPKGKGKGSKGSKGDVEASGDVRDVTMKRFLGCGGGCEGCHHEEISRMEMMEMSEIFDIHIFEIHILMILYGCSRL